MGGGLLERDNQPSFKDSSGGAVLSEVTAHSLIISPDIIRGVMMIVTGSQACLLLLDRKNSHRLSRCCLCRSLYFQWIDRGFSLLSVTSAFCQQASSCTRELGCRRRIVNTLQVQN